jgi:8-oxo-dGTP pyrophosphatase MutT (NUDIX family)/phosphohistidine phosphatase SixA
MGLTGEPVRAGGGVLWRYAAGNGANNIEVAVVHRPRYDDWSIPKGKLKPGELDLEGAIREVNEETGYRVSIGRPLGEITYLKDGRPKSVRYWAMRSEGGVFTPTREVDELRWLPAREAEALLTQPRDREILTRFSDGPVSTRAVLLVRHGSAGSRSDWRGDDDERPLDGLGLLQADALVCLLTRFDIREIHSADLVRCTQTLEPLSKAVGLPINSQPLLSERYYYDHEEDGVDFVRSVGADGMGAALCSQGGVIPSIVRRLAALSSYELPGALPQKKGSVWFLTLADGQLHDAEYLPPLA